MACLTSPLWAFFTSYGALTRWAAAVTVFKHGGVDELWPGLLAFQAPGDLAASFATARQGWAAANPTRRALVAPLTLLSLAWAYLVRTPLQLLLSAVGKIVVGVGLVGLVSVGAILRTGVGLLVTLTNPLLLAFDAGYGTVRRGYPVVLRAALRQPAMTALALLGVTSTVLWYTLPQLGMELIPEVRQGIFDIHARLPVGTPLEKTDATIGPLERIVRATPGVASVATTVGVDRDEFDPDPEAGEHSGRLTVRLTRTTSPILYEDSVMAAIREQLQGRPNLVIKFSRPAMFTTKTPIEVEVRADDLDTLRRVADALAQRLKPLPELTDVKSTLQRGHPEIQIQYDRERLSHYGLDIARVASLVRNKIQGDVATRFRRGDRRVDIRVRVRPEDRATVADLEQLVVNPGQLNPIRLESVATLRLAEGPSEIRRIDQRRSAVIGANTTTDLSRATAAIETVL
jgi:HAE1 family hydrophobic/amphiphilic exporter-1